MSQRRSAKASRSQSAVAYAVSGPRPRAGRRLVVLLVIEELRVEDLVEVLAGAVGHDRDAAQRDGLGVIEGGRGRVV